MSQALMGLFGPRFIVVLNWRRVHSQSTVEYALVGALVVIAAAAALTVLGEQVTAVFGNVSNTLRTAASH
jgi:Flp pilus assembly pilin Flp